jgi:voltage-gated potassium channel
MSESPHLSRAKLHRIIFGVDTKAGRLFDVILIIFILSSVLVVMLDSVTSIHINYVKYIKIAEWFFTLVFTFEYFLRLYVVRSPIKYATSFFGIVDLISIIPTYLSLLFAGSHYLAVIRTLRLLRVFRILKLVQYLNQADVLMRALKASRPKIIIFLFTVTNVVIIIGSVMYVIEGESNGFTSIPKSIYWAIVTLTTVGYGDISPQTPVGQMLASIVMILGYGIIAVPTGIVTMEMNRAHQASKQAFFACPSCGHDISDIDANFCKNCGYDLNRE